MARTDEPAARARQRTAKAGDRAARARQRTAKAGDRAVRARQRSAKAGQRRDVRRRPGGRSARVRSAVLAAALEELAACGYAALGFEGIARRAGVHKTTLYRRWASREDLLLEAMLGRGAELVPIPDTGSLYGDLVEYGEAIVRGLEEAETDALVRAVASVADRHSMLAEAGHRFWRRRFELAGEMVERAVARGEIAQQAEPDLVVEALIAPIYFRLLMSRERLDGGFVERLAGFVAAGAGAPRVALDSPPGGAKR